MPDTPEVTFSVARLCENDMALFAQLLSVVVRPGDVIALEGEVGAGKTTFARAFIRAILGNHEEEIPSPTYTLVQTYESARLNVGHFDLYRLGEPDELDELGLDHALLGGVAIIEWPGQAGDRLPGSRLLLRLCDPNDGAGGGGTRDLQAIGFGAWAGRCGRLGAMFELIRSSHWWDELRSIAYLAGDASARRYARLVAKDGRRALVMDWPFKPDRTIVRDGKTYNQIAHIADNVVPFIGVANALRDGGFSAPEIYGFDEDNGLVVLEDLGDQVFFDEVHKGASMADMWRAATDTLVALRAFPVPDVISVTGGVSAGVSGGEREHVVPRFDRGAIMSELDLLQHWYWPAVHGVAMPDATAERFTKLWDGVIDTVLTEPPAWCLRDYHSPNLVWLAKQTGAARVGIIDFQDACVGPAAYDLVSLLQDARVSVPEVLEMNLLGHYCTSVLRAEPSFDRDAFLFSYAALGAQRNTKILGIFARLAKRDGKPHYLAHIPRIWGYLDRCLQHPGLLELASWYDEAFRKDVRHRHEDLRV